MVDLLHLTHDGGIRLSTYLLPSPQGFILHLFIIVNYWPFTTAMVIGHFFNSSKGFFLQLRFTDIFWDRANIPSMVVHHLVNKFE